MYSFKQTLFLILIIRKKKKFNGLFFFDKLWFYLFSQTLIDFRLTKRSAASLFNVGRAYQQLALNNYAVRYYREALLDETAPLQLKRKIAFNISIIFKDAHNDGLVRGLYEQYLTF